MKFILPATLHDGQLLFADLSVNGEDVFLPVQLLRVVSAEKAEIMIVGDVNRTCLFIPLGKLRECHTSVNRTVNNLALPV